MEKDNIFKPVSNPGNDREFFEVLKQSADVKIERIIGLKPYNSPGEWLDQVQDEWVLLLQGSAELEIREEKIITLEAGDFVYIEAHKVHRVNRTSSTPQCIWLAVFGKMK